MTNLLTKTPMPFDPATDVVVVHRRPADYDPEDPDKRGTIEVVTLVGSGDGGGPIDGGSPDDESLISLDGGEP